MAGIYIHIPFCKKLCSYCDFYHVISKGDNRAFLKAVISEASLRKDYLGDQVVETVYFGGGTPSVFTAGDTGMIINHLQKEFNIAAGAEITIELNPDDVNEQYARSLIDYGVNRVSLGVQSWHDSDLKLLNRRHDSRGAAAALDNIFKAGIENVSIDLIYGIPGMTSKSWISNLDRSFSYAIKHLSAYHLTFEKGTVFGKMLEKGLIHEIDEEESNNLFNILIKRAEEAKFIHYEISNFGKEGYFSRHNSNYWKQVSYLGLGPSAHSFDGYSRQWNKSNLNSYIKSVEAGEPEFEREELDSRIRFNEYIMTSLRTMWGIDLGYVEKTFEKEGYDYVVNYSTKFREYGMMRLENNTLVLTDSGKMISDNIISEFMMPGD